MRLDIRLVELSLADSRSRAKSMIEEGYVSVNGRICEKPSLDVCDADVIECSSDAPTYVSRGALKLEGALEAFHVDPTDMLGLDVGASTGGFTECLLRHGASHVWAVDSGRDQLHFKLRSDPRVTSIEGFNAREMSPELTGCLCDIAVCDVSFISQTLLHAPIASMLKANGIYISLIKPQFEVGRANIGKNGIVKSANAVQNAVMNVIDSAKNCGFVLRGFVSSPIKGGDGNSEFLAYFTLASDEEYTEYDISRVSDEIGRHYKSR